MGSVIDYIPCPNCKHEAFNDFYYKSGEEWTICNNCGYYHAYTRDEDSNEFKEILIQNPYGYYHAYHAEVASSGIGGSLETKEDIIQLLDAISTDPNVKIVKLSQYIDGQIIVKEVYNRTKYLRIKKLKHLNNEITKKR